MNGPHAPHVGEERARHRLVHLHSSGLEPAATLCNKANYSNATNSESGCDICDVPEQSKVGADRDKMKFTGEASSPRPGYRLSHCAAAARRSGYRIVSHRVAVHTKHQAVDIRSQRGKSRF
jgi:hypothetical protein